jgi:hypothetical protein
MNLQIPPNSYFFKLIKNDCKNPIVKEFITFKFDAVQDLRLDGIDRMNKSERKYYKKLILACAQFEWMKDFDDLRNQWSEIYEKETLEILAPLRYKLINAQQQIQAWERWGE